MNLFPLELKKKRKEGGCCIEAFFGLVSPVVVHAAYVSLFAGSWSCCRPVLKNRESGQNSRLRNRENERTGRAGRESA